MVMTPYTWPSELTLTLLSMLATSCQDLPSSERKKPEPEPEQPHTKFADPTEILRDLAAHKATNPDFNVARIHFFPLGGIKTNANWVIENGGASGRPAALD